MTEKIREVVDVKIMQELHQSEYLVFIAVTVCSTFSLCKEYKEDFPSSNAFPGLVVLELITHALPGSSILYFCTGFSRAAI